MGHSCDLACAPARHCSARSSRVPIPRSPRRSRAAAWTFSSLTWSTRAGAPPRARTTRGRPHDRARRAHPGCRSPRTCRAAHARSSGELGLLRRPPRHGAGGKRRRLGLPARVRRLRALLPQADRGAARRGSGTSLCARWSAAALERRASASNAAAAASAGSEGDVGHGAAYRFTDPDGRLFEVYHETERYRPPEHSCPRCSTSSRSAPAAASVCAGSSTSTSPRRTFELAGSSSSASSATAPWRSSSSMTAASTAPGSASPSRATRSSTSTRGRPTSGRLHHARILG